MKFRDVLYCGFLTMLFFGISMAWFVTDHWILGTVFLVIGGYISTDICRGMTTKQSSAVVEEHDTCVVNTPFSIRFEADVVADMDINGYIYSGLSTKVKCSNLTKWLHNVDLEIDVSGCDWSFHEVISILKGIQGGTYDILINACRERGDEVGDYYFDEENDRFFIDGAEVNEDKFDKDFSASYDIVTTNINPEGNTPIIEITAFGETTTFSFDQVSDALQMIDTFYEKGEINE